MDSETAPAKQPRILVTAGAAGIGQAIAARFIQSGARVYICDIDKDALLRELARTPSLIGRVADVGSPEDVRSMLAEVFDLWGGIDVLVNNAGIGGPRGAIEDIDPAEWRRCMAVNLDAAYLLTAGVVPGMKAQGGGSIVNIATSSARTGLPYRTPYVVSKAGLIALTRNMARELGPHGIRCNAILPGIVDNERGRALMIRLAQERSLTPEQGREEFLRYVSMRTAVEPQDVAEMAFFLSSDSARYVSGQAIGVCGNVEWEE